MRTYAPLNYKSEGMGSTPVGHTRKDIAFHRGEVVSFFVQENMIL